MLIRIQIVREYIQSCTHLHIKQTTPCYQSTPMQYSGHFVVFLHNETKVSRVRYYLYRALIHTRLMLLLVLRNNEMLFGYLGVWRGELPI